MAYFKNPPVVEYNYYAPGAHEPTAQNGWLIFAMGLSNIVIFGILGAEGTISTRSESEFRVLDVEHMVSEMGSLWPLPPVGWVPPVKEPEPEPETPEEPPVEEPETPPEDPQDPPEEEPVQ